MLEEEQECPPFYLFSPPAGESSLREFLAESLPLGCRKWEIRSACDLVADIGLGEGSRRLYENLRKHLGKVDFSAWVFYYLQPDIGGHNRVLLAIMEMAKWLILMEGNFPGNGSDEKMSDVDQRGRCRIRSEMTILEVIERHPQTEAVFRKYDQQAGVCLCCQALFEPLGEMAERYHLNLETLLDDLHRALGSD